MRNADEIKEEMGIEDPLVNTSVHVQRLLIEVLLDVRDLIEEQSHLYKIGSIIIQENLEVKS